MALSTMGAMPRCPRPNTVSFTIDHLPAGSRAGYEWVARNLIKTIPVNSIAQIQPRGNNTYLLSFKCQVQALRAAETGFMFEGHNVNIQPVTGGTTVITILDAPYELPNTAVARALSFYGEVVTIENLRVKEELGGFLNGDRKATLVMKKPVPNILHVQGWDLLCWYRDVDKVCRRCGRPGHFAAACQAAPPRIKRCLVCGNRWHSTEECNGCTNCRTEAHPTSQCPEKDRAPIDNDQQHGDEGQESAAVEQAAQDAAPSTAKPTDAAAKQKDAAARPKDAAARPKDVAARPKDAAAKKKDALPPPAATEPTPAEVPTLHIPSPPSSPFQRSSKTRRSPGANRPKAAKDKKTTAASGPKAPRAPSAKGSRQPHVPAQPAPVYRTPKSKRALELSDEKKQPRNTSPGSSSDDDLDEFTKMMDREMDKAFQWQAEQKKQRRTHDDESGPESENPFNMED